MGINIGIQHWQPELCQVASHAAFAAGDTARESNAALRSLPAGRCAQGEVFR